MREKEKILELQSRDLQKKKLEKQNDSKQMFEFSIHYSLLLHIILEDGFICVLHYMMLGLALARPDNAFTSGTIPRLTLRKQGPLVREH